jgi:hypothetical protein
MRGHPVVQKENFPGFLRVPPFVRLEQGRAAEIGKKNREAYQPDKPTHVRVDDLRTQCAGCGVFSTCREVDHRVLEISSTRFIRDAYIFKGSKFAIRTTADVERGPWPNTIIPGAADAFVGA